MQVYKWKVLNSTDNCREVLSIRANEDSFVHGEKKTFSMILVK